MTGEANKDYETSQSGIGCLTRLAWMGGGPIALAYLTVFIAQRDDWSPSVLDAAFLIVVALMVALRWFDIHSLRGQTVEGTPATARDWKHYCLGLIAIALALWILAKVVCASGLLR